jgi:hypothetical protein
LFTRGSASALIRYLDPLRGICIAAWVEIRRGARRGGTQITTQSWQSSGRGRYRRAWRDGAEVVRRIRVGNPNRAAAMTFAVSSPLYRYELIAPVTDHGGGHRSGPRLRIGDRRRRVGGRAPAIGCGVCPGCRRRDRRGDLPHPDRATPTDVACAQRGRDTRHRAGTRTILGIVQPQSAGSTPNTGLCQGTDNQDEHREYQFSHGLHAMA